MNNLPTYGQPRTNAGGEDYIRLGRRLHSMNANRTTLAAWLGVRQQAVSKWASRGIAISARPAVAAAVARPISWVENGGTWTTDLPLDIERDRVLWRVTSTESYSVQVIPARGVEAAETEKAFLGVFQAVWQVTKGPEHAFVDETTAVDYLQRRLEHDGYEVERGVVLRGLQIGERYARTRLEPDFLVSRDGKLVAAVAVRSVTRWANTSESAPESDAEAPERTAEKPLKTFVATADFPDFGVRVGDALTIGPADEKVTSGLYVLRVASGAEQTFFVEAPVIGQQYTIFPGAGPRCYPALLDWLQDNMVGRVVYRAGAVP